jgi:hypothetical protein
MSGTKKAWHLSVKKTGEVIIKSPWISGVVRTKSRELIKEGKDKDYHIRYFENDLFEGAEELDVYFS